MRNMEHVAVSIHYFPREFFVLQIATSISMLFQTADARVQYFFFIVQHARLKGHRLALTLSFLPFARTGKNNFARINWN